MELRGLRDLSEEQRHKVRGFGVCWGRQGGDLLCPPCPPGRHAVAVLAGSGIPAGLLCCCAEQEPAGSACGAAARR